MNFRNRGIMLALATIGGLGLAIPPPREPEIDLGEVEKVASELTAADINVHDVLAAAGSPDRFVETGRRCIAMRTALQAQGVETTDVAALLKHAEMLGEQISFAERHRPLLGLSVSTPGMTREIERFQAYESHLCKLAQVSPAPRISPPVRHATPPTTADRNAFAFLHPAGRCTCKGSGDGDCAWCEMNRRRELREGRPVMREHQRGKRRAAARKKARRGW